MNIIDICDPYLPDTSYVVQSADDIAVISNLYKTKYGKCIRESKNTTYLIADVIKIEKKLKLKHLGKIADSKVFYWSYPNTIEVNPEKNVFSWYLINKGMPVCIYLKNSDRKMKYITDFYKFIDYIEKEDNNEDPRDS